MTTIGFCGLGTMGMPMAAHLADAGFELVVWTHTAEKATAFAEAHPGCRAVATPSDVGSAADIVFVIVGDTSMSETVFLGANGLLRNPMPGAIVVESSTVSPEHVGRCAAACTAAGVRYVDAPCTGSRPGAEAGNLTFMIGGDASTVDELRPVLDPMAAHVHHCGAIGLGMVAKLSQNLVLANLAQVLSESLVLATAAGLDPDIMLGILEDSAARTGYAAFKAPYILRRDFEPNFSLRWMAKDVHLMLQQAAALGVPLPVTHATSEWYDRAIDAGLGDDDFCGVVRLTEALAGTEVRGD